MLALAKARLTLSRDWRTPICTISLHSKLVMTVYLGHSNPPPHSESVQIGMWGLETYSEHGRTGARLESVQMQVRGLRLGISTV